MTGKPWLACTEGVRCPQSTPKADGAATAVQDYVSAVFTLARNIDYDLPHDVKRDQGIPGRFYASHAEKLLVAFLVSKHIFLPEEARYVDQARMTRAS